MRAGVHRGRAHERRGLHRRRLGPGRSPAPGAAAGARRGRLPARFGRRLRQPAADDPVHVCRARVLRPPGGGGEAARVDPGDRRGPDQDAGDGRGRSSGRAGRT
ncbi:MAG: hypothetical protein MZV70_10455 [Desulfobacterales bacterium]|nr:hypothetical protein [Desulfobacterales bacterium]